MELNIGLVLPDVLGTYGDDGNALVLKQRARLRGISAEIQTVRYGEAVPEGLDIYTLGGGEDTAQVLAAEHLRADGGLGRAAAAGRVVFGVCAGLQVLGESFHAGDRVVAGLGVLDARTSRLQERMIGELVADPAGAGAGVSAEASRAGEGARGGVAGVLAGSLTETLTGFANHRGASLLGPDARPLGLLHSRSGMVGNTDAHAAAGAAGAGAGTGANDVSASDAGAGLSAAEASEQQRYEGAVQGSVVATYMHGPALARNPQLADALLAAAMGLELSELPELGGAGGEASTGVASMGAGIHNPRAFAAQLSAEVAQLREERLR